MEMSTEYKLANIGEGSADVTVDGQVIGAVRFRKERYNLRRLIVGRYWDAYVDGTVVSKGYPTRRAAAAAVVLIAERGTFVWSRSVPKDPDQPLGYSKTIFEVLSLIEFDPGDALGHRRKVLSVHDRYEDAQAACAVGR